MSSVRTPKPLPQVRVKVQHDIERTLYVAFLECLATPNVDFAAFLRARGIASLSPYEGKDIARHFTKRIWARYFKRAA